MPPQENELWSAESIKKILASPTEDENMASS
jgi:hypothetical protein